ncbi:hypothetical protein [Halorussus salinus]|uniref:hypothetical protein n=1 Tax=Halorussus salinus TaxID=1364935 RepID=UPI00138F9400|nr:hypothetical protein [Halorussus salinus]
MPTTTKVRPEDGAIECRGCGSVVATYPQTASQPPRKARKAAAMDARYCEEVED